MFNEHYINIVEHSSGIPPTKISNKEPSSDVTDVITKIIKVYKNHASVRKIREVNKTFQHSFSFSEVDSTCIKKILHKTNTKKATGYDKIPGKIIKLAKDVLSQPL